MRHAILLMILFFTLPFHLMGQQKDYVLKGVLHMKGGENTKYKLVFKATGDNIKGYAITYMQDGLELKAAINGKINKPEQTLYFKEVATPGMTMFEDCMVEAKLPYRLEKGVYVLKGSFRGKKNDLTCSEGTIAFDVAKEMNQLFDPPKTGRGAEHEEGDVQAGWANGGEAHDNVETITAAKEKVFEWNSDTCYMEIWDNEYIDGDIVTLVYNGRVVLSDYSLVRKKKQVKLPLVEQVNILTIIAENEGKVPPNTSRITLSDGKVKHNAFASISKGQGAIIILRKK